MNDTKLFSSGERFILAVIIFLMCFSFYKDISNKIVDSYNEHVKYEQLEKLDEANNGKKEFHFTFYDSCSRGPSLWELIISLQFISDPLLFFLIKRETLKAFVFSAFINFLTFFSYFAWAYNAFNLRRLNGSYYFRDISEIGFGSYLLPGSTVLQQFSFALISALLILQGFILIRFAMEKFNGKISLA